MRVTPYLDRIEIAEGQYLTHKGEILKGLYFIERGQIAMLVPEKDGHVRQLTIMDTGSIFGESGLYSQRTTTSSTVVVESAVLYYLSEENLRRVEADDPELANALHRLFAANLVEKLTQSNETVRALQS